MNGPSPWNERPSASRVPVPRRAFFAPGCFRSPTRPETAPLPSHVQSDRQREPLQTSCRTGKRRRRRHRPLRSRRQPESPRQPWHGLRIRSGKPDSAWSRGILVVQDGGLRSPRRGILSPPGGLRQGHFGRRNTASRGIFLAINSGFADTEGSWRGNGTDLSRDGQQTVERGIS